MAIASELEAREGLMVRDSDLGVCAITCMLFETF